MMEGDTNRGIDLTFFEGNPSWEITDTAWSENRDSYESSIVFTIKLKRKPLFVMISIFLPVLLLCILNLFTFQLPCSGGEKSGFAVTIFLSFAVLLTIVTATMPENSEYVALFSLYMVFLTFLSTVIAMVVLLENTATSFNETKPIPGWLMRLSSMGRRLSFSKGCCVKSKTRNKVDVVNEEEVAEKDIEMEDKANSDKYIQTWQSTIDDLDSFLFVFFCSLSIIVTFLFMMVTAFGS